MSSETADIQVVLSQKADVAQTYTKFDTYSTAEVDAKFTNLIDAAPLALSTLKELATALNDDSSFASTVANSLAAKAPIASPTFTGTVTGISQSMVGLSNVNNTTDAFKPISTATQAGLDAKAPLANPTFTGTVTGITQSMVWLD